MRKTRSEQRAAPDGAVTGEIVGRDQGLRYPMEAQSKMLPGNLLSIAYLCRGTGRAGVSFVKMCIQLCHVQNFPFTTNWSEAVGPSQGFP